METVETKNSKLWLILAIVFGVLIPILMLPKFGLIIFFLWYTPIVGSLYSWFILPKVKTWYIFAPIISLLMSINQMFLKLPYSPRVFLAVGAFIWSFYWFFVPCIRFIKNRAFRNFCCIVFLIFTLAVAIPIELILINVVQVNFTAYDTFSFNRFFFHDLISFVRGFLPGK